MSKDYTRITETCLQKAVYLINNNKSLFQNIFTDGYMVSQLITIYYKLFTKNLYNIKECVLNIKGAVSRDFRPLYFFINRTHLGP